MPWPAAIPWCRRSCRAGSTSGPNSVADGEQAVGDGIERFVPGDAFEAAFALGADAPLRIEQAIGVILALEIPGDFAAEKSARDRMRRVATQLRAASVIDINEQRAGVGAIERAHGVAGFGHR